MIISKTPYRISFFGGGTDYPLWFKKYKGNILSTTIDKHVYLSLRNLPPYFNYKYRIVWSKVENVKNLNLIQHNVVREMFKYFKLRDGIDLHYQGDLPARSGMGSSSSFVVGLMKILLLKKKINVSNQELAKHASSVPAFCSVLRWRRPLNSWHSIMAPLRCYSLCCWG